MSHNSGRSNNLVQSDAFVEVIRLALVLAAIAGGYELGTSEPTWLSESLRDSGTGVLMTTLLGAAIGYVIGGIVGRWVSRMFISAERRVERASVADILIGSVGAFIGLLIGILITVPVALFLRPTWWIPIMVFSAWICGTFGYRISLTKRDELLELGGLRAPSRAAQWRTNGIVVDTSVVIDGRLLGIARNGFIPATLYVPRFVLDELQGIADASDPQRRRRGRRGLEILDALHDEVSLETLDDEIPEIDTVDAKLVAIAKRRRLTLMTTDYNLQKVAELQEVPVFNVNKLADVLRTRLTSGDMLTLRIEAEGREDAQGVGYLDDGAMVVVSNAAGAVGETVRATVTSAHQTSVGKMYFATMVEVDSAAVTDSVDEIDERRKRRTS